MAGRLEKPHVFDIGVQDVQLLERDALAPELPPQLTGHDQIAGDGDGAAIHKEKRVRQVRRQVRLHDQVRRLAVGEPHSADRRHRRAYHDGVPDRGYRRGREHQDDDQRSNRQADHRDAAQNARHERDHRCHCDDRRHDEAVEPPQQEERQAFEQPGLSDHRHHERQAQDEQHRVGVNQVVESVKRQQVRGNPDAPPLPRDFGVPRGRRKPAERRDDDEEHPVGQRVLVNLVPEGSEDEQPQDGGQHLGRQQPERNRRRAAEDQNGSGSNNAGRDKPPPRQHDDCRGRWDGVTHAAAFSM